MMSEENQNGNLLQIKIFATENGINVVKSPVKSIILSLLRESELNFDKIVDSTGKSPSTISVHLKDLINQGIIDSKLDPDDKRRKIFFIKSRFLGDLTTAQKFEDDIEEYMKYYQSHDSDPFEFFRIMFRTIRVSLLNEGVNINPLLQQAGISIGKIFYQTLSSPNTETLLDNLGQFWKNHKLGTIIVKNKDPLIIHAYDCFECEDLPKIGVSACALDSGILTAVFSMHFKQTVSVDEVECYARGDDHCSFIITKNVNE
jgi:predicted hydrocarbon binding protein/DNA-binding MarR family transcriptional regulator